MHIWTIENWTKLYDLENPDHRTGLRLRCDKEVDPEVKRACKEFCAWLRSEYFFPIRIPVYVKKQRRIKAKDGDLVMGTFWAPYNKQEEPYIRVPSGDFQELLEKYGKDDALASILHSIAHELTHYFQWINSIQLTEIGEERQATRYAGFILAEYFETREHP